MRPFLTALALLVAAGRYGFLLSRESSAASLPADAALSVMPSAIIADPDLDNCGGSIQSAACTSTNTTGRVALLAATSTGRVALLAATSPSPPSALHVVPNGFWQQPDVHALVPSLRQIDRSFHYYRLGTLSLFLY